MSLAASSVDFSEISELEKLSCLQKMKTVVKHRAIPPSHLVSNDSVAFVHLPTDSHTSCLTL